MGARGGRARTAAGGVGRDLARAELGGGRRPGRGHLLAQQLVAVGEQVLDVQPKLAARVRLLAAGDTNKNDPNDARSVAIAALRSADCRQVQADDHTAVLKLWSKRHRDLGRSRNHACRLHAVLCELVPGGVRKESPHLTRPACWRPPSRPARLRPRAGSWPATSSRTCDALTSR